MIGRRSPAIIGAVAAIAALALTVEPAHTGPPPRKSDARIVLLSDQGGERTVDAPDLRFAYFITTYYNKAASRSRAPSGRRTEVMERREECRCLRLPDWSKIEFKKLRQIEVLYPETSRRARLRLTLADGHVQEIAAADLHGAGGTFPPRFGATVDGLYREFPLALGDDAPAGWPDERLTRILIVRSRPPGSRRR